MNKENYRDKLFSVYRDKLFSGKEINYSKGKMWRDRILIQAIT